MKVFELANELNIGALDVVEKLREKGLNIRNHMVKLSDDELVMARELFGSGTAESKKETEKKTAKKATTKKAAVRKTKTKKTDEVDEDQTEKESSPVVKTRRKIVVKRKSSKKAESEANEEANSNEESAAASNTTSAEELQAQGIATIEESETTSDKTVVKEKMHTFTPVYVPETQKEESKESTLEAQEAQEKKEDKSNIVIESGVKTMKRFTPISMGDAGTKSSNQDEDSNDIDSDDEDGKFKLDKESSKKRMGDLAAIVAKKSVSNKSKEMVQLRADEEMKLATTLVGGTVYTPQKRKKIYNGPTRKTQLTEVKDSKKFIVFHDFLTGEDIAQKLSQKFSAVQKETLNLNIILRKEDIIGPSLIAEICALFGYRAENKAFDVDKVISASTQTQEKKKNEQTRAPIITIMGHVDHGKTTLLDQIRKTKVVSGEAGGITQHIGAYSVDTPRGKITFLDTPGHAAFANMRQRGADVTDIVVLVVAADDGIMPQTVESIKFCQNANKPIIVAVNKMDKEGANPDRVKQALVEYNLTSEDWGGDTQFVPVSALKGDGIDELLESIIIQSEVMELVSSPKGAAQGVVVESKIELGRGPVTTLIVQSGTLKKGDSLVVGETYGRARSIMNHAGENLKDAGPSMPVQILGLNEAASPGDILSVVKNEREAQKIAQHRIDEKKKLNSTTVKKVASLEDFFKAAPLDGVEKKILKLIVRADVQGSYEAIKNAVESIGNDEVGVQVIGGGIGAITDSDVSFAEQSSGYILGFNMRPVTSARKLSEEKGVDVKTYTIIYELINHVKLAVEGLLEPERIEKYIGRAEVRETFNIPKVGIIAGTAVIDGKIARGCNIRLLREGKIIFDGKLSTLKRFKDEVKEVNNGYECGMALENFNDIKNSDIFEAYIFEEKKRTLDMSNQTL